MTRYAHWFLARCSTGHELHVVTEGSRPCTARDKAWHVVRWDHPEHEWKLMEQTIAEST